jgi:sugar transferase EpsL
MSAHGRWYRAAKRAVDVVLSGAALVATAPVLAVSAAAVAISLGRPVLFRQQRPGLGGRPFTMYKFRTMRPPRSGETWFRTDAERLTAVGRFLRRTSIDELPELWNVLRGDMSIVGPRPLLMEYLPKYTETENRRHEVKPGITGWAQINGRQTIPFSKRLELDVWYVDHLTIWLDLAIIARTARQIFRSGEVISGQNVDEVDDIGLSADRRRTGGGPSGGSE